MISGRITIRLATTALLLIAARDVAAAESRSKVLLSQTYTIDKKYRSMEGPQSSVEIFLNDDRTAEPELLWITGVKTEIISPDGTRNLSPELMCHVNVDIDAANHKRRLRTSGSVSSRLVTLSQGQVGLKVPDGFGYPIMSDEAIWVTTQVLNLNDDKLKLDVKHRVTIDYAREKDAPGKIKALLNTSVFGLAPVENKPPDAHDHAAMSHDAVEHEAGGHGTSCLIAPPGLSGKAPNATMGSEYLDETGKTLTGHWVVPPGRQVTRNDVTRYLDLPFDTKVHSIAVHLHPFAESIELRDATAGTTVFKSRAEGVGANRIGLSRVDSFRSEEGVPLLKAHKYELVTTYNNTSDQNQDSMAVLYLGVVDPNFTSPLGKTKIALLHTNLGVLRIRLRPDLAPQTVEHFTRMAESGVYNTNYFSRVVPNFVAQVGVAEDRESPLLDEQKGTMTKLPLEDHGARHLRGVVSMARPDDDPDGAISSFSILLGDQPHLDGKYTIFGQVIDSDPIMTKLDEFAAVAKPIERLQILRAEVVETELK